MKSTVKVVDSGSLRDKNEGEENAEGHLHIERGGIFIVRALYNCLSTGSYVLSATGASERALLVCFFSNR